jgi:hypothetical protein
MVGMERRHLSWQRGDVKSKYALPQLRQEANQLVVENLLLELVCGN